MIVQQQARRICWPNPDATCLEGGCGYCNDSPFRALAVIRKYAESAGQVHNRNGGKTQDAVTAYNYGFRHNFFNAETRGPLGDKLEARRKMATPKKRTFPAHEFTSQHTVTHEPTDHIFRQEEQMIVVSHEGVDVATFTTEMLAIPGAHLTETALRKAAQQWLKEQDGIG